MHTYMPKNEILPKIYQTRLKVWAYMPKEWGYMPKEWAYHTIPNMGPGPCMVWDTDTQIVYRHHQTPN